MAKNEIIGSELERIREKHGRLAPSIVLAEAQPEDSPLHNEFEWDDSVAAHEYRLQQARKLIRLHVTYDEATKDLYHTYIHIPAAQGEGYYQHREVLIRQRNVDDDLAAAKQEAVGDLIAATRAIREIEKIEAARKASKSKLKHLASATTAIDTAKQELDLAYPVPV